jgi:hypothetical protein
MAMTTNFVQTCESKPIPTYIRSLHMLHLCFDLEKQLVRMKGGSVDTNLRHRRKVRHLVSLPFLNLRLKHVQQLSPNGSMDLPSLQFRKLFSQIHINQIQYLLNIYQKIIKTIKLIPSHLPEPSQ